MKSLGDAHDSLIKTGKWEGNVKLLKKNCEKCYDRRHVGFNTTTQQYIPCKCLRNKLEAIQEFEKKTMIMAIGSDQLKDI